MATQKKKNQKVIKYKKARNFNVGMVIFGLIFLYIVFAVYTYMMRDQIKFYEVLKGSIVKEEQYTGIALRQESAVEAPSSGYVNYYIQEGHRVAVGSKVYTIDENGSLQSYLAEHPELSGAFSDEQLKELRSKLSSFSMNLEDSDFSRLYDTKYSLDAAALEYSSISSTQDLDAVLGQLGISYTQVAADRSGVVSYAIDGLESLTDAAVTAELFSMNGYKKTITKPGAAVEAGTPVYKIITSSEWNLVFPVNDEQRERYQDVQSIQIRFKDNDVRATAGLSIYTAQDGNNYGKLTLSQYMEDFCADRYIDFEIVQDDRTGLKLPVTAVTTKDFYVIPASFKATKKEDGKDDGPVGFYRQVVTGSGTGTEFVETDIYREDSQYCYIAIPENTQSSGSTQSAAETTAEGSAETAPAPPAPLKGGDFIVKEGTSQTYQLGPTGQVEGVYNINKGYAVFRQIVPIESNAEYVIVEEGTSSGIAVYDHIVLDASTVYEGELIYQ